MEKIKAIQIGFGKWGKKLALATEKYFDLAITDRASFEKHLANRDVEAVFIATPINTHYEIALKALEAGKHVFLEKPGGESALKLKELADIANDKGLTFQIGYEFIFGTDIEGMRKVLEGKKVNQISFEWKKMGTFDFHPVINLLVHELSILLALQVWPISITQYKEVKGEHDPDSVHIEARSGDIDIVFDIDRNSELKEKTIRMKAGEEEYSWQSGSEPLVNLEIQAFLNSINMKMKPIATGEFGAEILRTIEQIPYRAS